MTAQLTLPLAVCPPHDWAVPSPGDERLSCRWCRYQSTPIKSWPSYQLRSVIAARRTDDCHTFALALTRAWSTLTAR